jgi:hypothetical protein
MASQRSEFETKYNDLWVHTVFTSLGYFFQILSYSDQKAENFVGYSGGNGLPYDIRDKIMERIQEASDCELSPLFKNRHGLCTAWAVLIVHETGEEAEAETEEEFKYFDSDKHRLALGHTSGVLIDSSAREVIQLKENDWVVGAQGIKYHVTGLGSKTQTFNYEV